MQFAVQNAFHYDGSFPSFRQPTEIGCFSLDTERQFHDDNHQLKYLVMPRSVTGLHLDLNKGYSEAVKKDFNKKEKIDVMLRWIIAHQEKVKNIFKVHGTNTIKVDFVCFRGLLTDICSTAYENKDDWLICATKYKSVIFLCAFDTDQDVQRRAKMTEREKLMSAWGYKFEQYMVSDSKTSKPNISIPVNEKEEYCILLKGRLNNHTLLYGAEVDGEDPSYSRHPGIDPNSTRRYMELKTSRIITNERQDLNFCRYKLLKWWIQSFLVGIPKVICGFRDDQGIVRNLKVFHVKEMPRMAENLWSPAACLNFCSQFLDFVKHCVVKDDPHVVYKFYWKPGSDVTCEELLSPPEYQILPDWFISEFYT